MIEKIKYHDIIPLLAGGKVLFPIRSGACQEFVEFTVAHKKLNSPGLKWERGSIKNFKLLEVR